MICLCSCVLCVRLCLIDRPILSHTYNQGSASPLKDHPVSKLKFQILICWCSYALSSLNRPAPSDKTNFKQGKNDGCKNSSKYPKNEKSKRNLNKPNLRSPNELNSLTRKCATSAESKVPGPREVGKTNF